MVAISGEGDGSGAGVGVGVGLCGSSKIGAGSRLAEIKSMTKQSQRPITFIVDCFQASAKTH